MSTQLPPEGINITDFTNVPVADRGEAKSIRSSRTGGEEPTPNSKVPASAKEGEPGLGYVSAAADQGGEGAPVHALPANTNFRTVPILGDVS